MRRSMNRLIVPSATVTVVMAAIAALAGAQGPQPKYKRDLPPALLKQAKVAEAAAAKTAQARMPTARIQAVELENENGRLIYSYELKIAGHSGIEEVNVNARTGAVVNTEHESPGAEGGEAKGEAGEAGERGGN